MGKIRRQIRLYAIRILRLKDSPAKVALGFSLGAAMNFYPTFFGLGLLLAVLIAKAFRANVVASLTGDLMFKTIFPLFLYFDFVTGEVLTGQKASNWEAISVLVESWQPEIIWQLGKAFFLGAIVNSIGLALVLFSVFYPLLARHRKKMLRYIYYNQLP